MIKFFTQTLPGIKYFSFWVLLLGIGFYFIGYFEIWDYSLVWGFSYKWFYDFLKTMGSVFMSSAVFMGIVKSYQFTGIFKEELRKVVFAEDHLTKRKDLDNIWEKITLQLCNQKFKQISNKLQKIIKQYYLPIEDDYYYKNTKLVVEIEKDPDNPNYVNIIEEFTYTVDTEDLEKIDFKFTSSIPFSKKDNNLTSFELKEFTINDEDIIWKKGKELKESRTSNILNNSFNIKLDCVKEKKDYIVYRKQKKRFSLIENPYMGHTASWLYENYDFHITYPKEMSFDWLAMGVLGKWKIKRSENTYSKSLKATYTGLMFKNQGFLLLFK